MKIRSLDRTFAKVNAQYNPVKVRDRLVNLKDLTDKQIRIAFPGIGVNEKQEELIALVEDIGTNRSHHGPLRGRDIERWGSRSEWVQASPEAVSLADQNYQVWMLWHKSICGGVQTEEDAEKVSQMFPQTWAEWQEIASRLSTEEIERYLTKMPKDLMAKVVADKVTSIPDYAKM